MDKGRFFASLAALFSGTIVLTWVVCTFGAWGLVYLFLHPLFVGAGSYRLLSSRWSHRRSSEECLRMCTIWGMVVILLGLSTVVVPMGFKLYSDPNMTIELLKLRQTGELSPFLVEHPAVFCLLGFGGFLFSATVLLSPITFIGVYAASKIQ